MTQLERFFENEPIIGVVGAGQMGSGIAQVASQSGFEVVLHDVAMEPLNKGAKQIEKNLDRLLHKEKITLSQKKDILARIKTSTQLKDMKNCSVVIEAASENFEIKSEIFKKLDEYTNSDCILATNTSSIPITQLSAKTKRQDKAIGMHFMNPVSVMRLVEVIRGLLTSDHTHEVILELSKKMGKETVTVADYPGFLVNRILCPMINEAVFALESGIASAKDIDQAMKLGTHQPMGPLELADFIGLDTCLSIMEVLHAGLGEDKFRPAPLLRKYVQAGLLGKKVGRGFYQYGVDKDKA